jgi:hypothetical protein
MELFEAELLDTLRTRPAGQPVLEAFGRFVSQPSGILAADDPGAQQELLRVSRMIAASPTLRAREQQILSRYTESVAALLRDETGAGPHDLRPWIVAHTLLGLHAALIDYARRQLLEDTPGPTPTRARPAPRSPPGHRPTPHRARRLRH